MREIKFDFERIQTFFLHHNLVCQYMSMSLPVLINRVPSMIMSSSVPEKGWHCVATELHFSTAQPR